MSNDIGSIFFKDKSSILESIIRIFRFLHSPVLICEKPLEVSMTVGASVKLSVFR